MSKIILNIDAVNGKVEKQTIVEGMLCAVGYVRIHINGKPEYVHRVIWEHVNGPIPKGMHVDHINGNKADNRIINLRLVSPTQNAQNRHTAAKGTRSGVKGVGWDKHAGKWVAQIKGPLGRYKLGMFDSIDEASAAYAGAAALIHTHNPHAKKKP